jgi:hypothetical protein
MFLSFSTTIGPRNGIYERDVCILFTWLMTGIGCGRFSSSLNCEKLLDTLQLFAFQMVSALLN